MFTYYNVSLNVIPREMENIPESVTFFRELQKDKAARRTVVFRLRNIDEQSLARMQPRLHTR